MFNQRYGQIILNATNTNFYYVVYQKTQLAHVASIVFDYLGCIYLMGKIKQLLAWYHQPKIIGQVTKLEA